MYYNVLKSLPVNPPNPVLKPVIHSICGSITAWQTDHQLACRPAIEPIANRRSRNFLHQNTL